MAKWVISYGLPVLVAALLFGTCLESAWTHSPLSGKEMERVRGTWETANQNCYFDDCCPKSWHEDRCGECYSKIPGDCEQMTRHSEMVECEVKCRCTDIKCEFGELLHCCTHTEEGTWNWYIELEKWCCEWCGKRHWLLKDHCIQVDP